jgi:hypothetical protein
VNRPRDGKTSATPRIKSLPDVGAVIGTEVEKLERLGFGSLTHPEIEQWIARVLLLYRMRQLCKADLIQLRESCVPACSALFDFGRQRIPDYPADFPAVSIDTYLSPSTRQSKLLVIDTWAKLREASLQYPVADELKLKIETWAVTRNLGVDWFLDALVRILCAWHTFPETKKYLRFGLPASFSNGPHQRLGSVHKELHVRINQLANAGPPLMISPYNPATQSREEHKAYVLNLLSSHHSSQEKRFLEAGFKATVLKRARSGRAWEHMGWFILYQIHGRKAAEIAGTVQGEAIGENAVTQAIRKLAGIMNIDVRSDTSPKKRKLKRSVP